MVDPTTTIPNGWELTALEEVAEITSSKRIFAYEYRDFGIPFFRGKEITEKLNGNDISTELFISEAKYSEIRDKFGVPEENDILLTSVGTLGNPYLVEKNLKFYFKDGNLTWFRKYKNTEPKFLFYWILSPQGKETLAYAKIGSTQEAYTISKLKRLPFILPPLPEQRAIVAVLSSLDEKIKLLRKQNKTLETIAKAIFREWFVNFNFPRQDEKPYKSNGGKMVNSELGEIPEGWRVGRLIEEGISGFVKTGIEEFNGEKDYVETSNVTLSRFVGDFENVTYERRPSRANMRPIENSFWFARMAESRKHLLFQPIDHKNVQAKILSTGFAGISCVKDYLYFYWCFILSDRFNSMKNQYAEGAVQIAINNNGIQRILLTFPPKDIAQKFTRIVSPLFEKISNNNYQTQTLTSIRKILLPKLIKGEIRASEFRD